MCMMTMKLQTKKKKKKAKKIKVSIFFDYCQRRKCRNCSLNTGCDPYVLTSMCAAEKRQSLQTGHQRNKQKSFVKKRLHNNPS